MTHPVPRPITYARVSRIALPVVLSNATVPLQGAIDTTIIGNQGEAVFLAAVVLGATALTLLFTSFNFLQMGASGLTAQAVGAGDRRRVVNTMLRAAMVAGAIALILIAFRGPVSRGALALFEGSAETEALAGAYIRIRLLGAPAEMANYALIGWFTGQELTRRLFEMQVTVSVLNVLLNLLFVVGLDLGVEGVAAATAIAAYGGLGVGIWRVRARIGALMPEGFTLDRARLLDPGELRQVLALNRNIFIRTLCLTGSFAWMARLGSSQGDTVLAANGVLMQFLHVSSYALDGFAMAAETLVGQALGTGERARLRRSVRVSAVSALMLATGLAAIFTALSESLVHLFTNVEAVREVAGEHALWATLMPLAGVLAYHMDGVFIGAAEGRRMRDAMVLSAGLFFPLGWILTREFGNDGLWCALWIWMLARAALLLRAYPAIEARTDAPGPVPDWQ